MKLIKRLVGKVRSVLNRPRVMHYAEVFAAALLSALWFERDQILGAHGLDALGCLVFAAVVTGVKAVLEAWRKSTPSDQASTVTIAVDNKTLGAAIGKTLSTSVSVASPADKIMTFGEPPSS